MIIRKGLSSRVQYSFRWTGDVAHWAVTNETTSTHYQLPLGPTCLVNVVSIYTMPKNKHALSESNLQRFEKLWDFWFHMSQSNKPYINHPYHDRFPSTEEHPAAGASELKRIVVDGRQIPSQDRQSTCISHSGHMACLPGMWNHSVKWASKVWQRQSELSPCQTYPNIIGLVGVQFSVVLVQFWVPIFGSDPKSWHPDLRVLQVTQVLVASSRAGQTVFWKRESSPPSVTLGKQWEKHHLWFRFFRWWWSFPNKRLWMVTIMFGRWTARGEMWC